VRPILCLTCSPLRLLECIACKRRYGQHLSKEQVAELVAAHPDTIELIGGWLEHHAVPASSASFSHGGSWLTLSGVPVAKADALMSASYRLYRHTETNETILRTMDYSLPAVLKELVQAIAPTSYFGSSNHRRSSQLMRNSLQYPSNGKKTQNPPTSLSGRGTEPRDAPACSQQITPSCLRQLYNMDSYTPSAKNNSIGLAEYFEGYASQSDLNKFMKQFSPNTSSSNISFVGVNGGANDKSNPSTEVRAVLAAGLVVTKTCNPTGCPQYPIYCVVDLPDASHLLRHKWHSELHRR
jgi:tripeptidyl-peptidase-1